METYSMNFTFEDLIKFVLRNKRGKTFRGMNLLQIALTLKVALDDNCLWYKEEHGQISGIIVFEKDDKLKIGFIKHNLAMTKANLIEFAKRAIRDYPDYTLHWYKNDKHRVWNTNKFYRKLGAL
jgi:hypothetical protein